jgi:hypothetical protein
MAANTYTPVDHPVIKSDYSYSEATFALLGSREIATFRYRDGESYDIVAYGGASGSRTLSTVKSTNRIFSFGDSLILASDTWGFLVLKDELLVGVVEKTIQAQRGILATLIEGPECIYHLSVSEGERIERIRAIDITGSVISVPYIGDSAILRDLASGWYMLVVDTNMSPYSVPVLVTR